MTVTGEVFQGRSRSASPGPSESRDYSDRRLLLQSLLALSQSIGSMETLRILFRKRSASVIRKAQLFSVLFEELVRDSAASCLSLAPASLCLEELRMVLERIKALLEECSTGSRMWLLMRVPSISISFHQLVGEFAMLLDIFPAKELDLDEDVRELLNLIGKQSSEKPGDGWDADDVDLRNKVLKTLENIKREIVPDDGDLSEIFNRLDLTDSASCSDEIQNLEIEVQNQEDRSNAAEAIALIGLLRYAKCALYGASPPRTAPQRKKSASDCNIPADFRCPVTLDLMTDPVAVSTGQTYDRPSITLWIESGHATCPKTGQPIAHTQLVPNLALKNLIAKWCRDQGIALDSTAKHSGVYQSKAALEATKMMVLFLVGKLTARQTPEATDRLVYELRVLAKTDSSSRACIAEAGALTLLAKFLGPEHPSLQLNAVTTILNLSIHEGNKARIMETDGVLSSVIEVLRSGATWEAKGNAAATIFSLSGLQLYRKKLGRKTRVVKALLDLARSGPTNSRRDALVAILNLAGDREAAAKLIEAGVVDLVSHVMEQPLAEEAVAILEVVVRRGGLTAIAAAYECKMVDKLIRVMRDGSDRAREGATATLVNICRKGGSEMAAELAAVDGIERVIWEIMGTGTGRARRKAASLLRIMRRWAAGLAVESEAAAVDESTNLSAVTTSTRLVLPA